MALVLYPTVATTTTTTTTLDYDYDYDRQFQQQQQQQQQQDEEHDKMNVFFRFMDGKVRRFLHPLDMFEGCDPAGCPVLQT
jgi:hypothetical protein